MFPLFVGVFALLVSLYFVFPARKKQGVVSKLFVYPVKACGGIELQALTIDKTGPERDREFMIVDSEWNFVTQRKFPKLALIKPSYDSNGQLTLSAPAEKDLTVVRRNGKDNMLPVRVWADNCQGFDQGDEVAAWLTKFLQSTCRLVLIAEVRPVPVPALSKLELSPQEKYGLVQCQVKFADGGPVMLLSEGSFENLNHKLENAVLINRFRPNIVVTGCEAFAEDKWKVVQINGVLFTVGADCTRCKVTTVDQEKGEFSSNQEPLKTLMSYRCKKGKHEPSFGRYMIPEREGPIQVGDAVHTYGLLMLLYINFHRITKFIPWILRHFFSLAKKRISPN